MTTLEGVIQRSGIGTGTWALVTRDGNQYQLDQDAPQTLLQPGLKVRVSGQIRNDVMTIAMIGPVLAVESFEWLDEYP
jgi:hypothetical protein